MLSNFAKWGPCIEKAKQNFPYNIRSGPQLVAEAKALAPYSKGSSQLIGSAISLFGCNQLQPKKLQTSAISVCEIILCVKVVSPKQKPNLE